MKIKKIMSNMICVSLVLSNFVVASASNVIIDESPINDVNTSTSSDIGWTTDESNLSDVEVTYQQSSNYFVTIPKTITLDSRKQATYSVKVTGDVDTNQRVYVSPVDVISNTEKVDFYMKDQNGRKSDVVATVTQNKMYWNSEEVTNGYEETDNSISAPDLTSGTWKGTFQVEIKLQTSNNTGNEDNKQQVAGLYDANDNLLVSWEDAGIISCIVSQKIREDYPATTKVVIPDSVTDIDLMAFINCSGLIEVIIPDSVINIDNSAFAGCTSLTKINIPNSVTKIGQQAFSDCTALKNIEIPDSVTAIGPNAFTESGLTEIVIPDSVTNISTGIFSNCKALENVVLSNSLTGISGFTFAGCTALKNVDIPDSITSIDMYAFSECESLTNLIVPDLVTSIGASAFWKVPHITYHGTATGSPWGAVSLN